MAQVHIPVEQAVELRERAYEAGVPIEKLITDAINVFLQAEGAPPPAGEAERIVRGFRRMQWRIDAAIMKISVAPGAAQKELTGLANEINELIELKTTDGE